MYKTAIYSLAQRSKSQAKLPSELYGIPDALAAFCFDAAIWSCGNVVDNALAERVELMVNGHKEYRPKYTLPQLLAPDFRLPTPQREVMKVQVAPSGFAALLAMAKQAGSGVRMWEYKPS